MNCLPQNKKQSSMEFRQAAGTKHGLEPAWQIVWQPNWKAIIIPTATVLVKLTFVVRLFLRLLIKISKRVKLAAT